MMAWTVAQQIAEQEKGSGHTHTVSKKSSGSGHPILTLAGVVLLIVSGFWFLQQITMPATYALASGDNAQRMANLQYQQQQLAYSMTQDAGRAIAQTSDAAARAQAAIQAQQTTSTAQAASTAWPITQSAIDAAQLKQQLDTQRMQDEYFWRQTLTPIKVYFWWIVLAAFVTAVFIMAIIAFSSLMPIWKQRVGVVTVERGQHTIHVGEKTITRTDLMPVPTLTLQKDDTMLGSGGFDDPQMQAQVARDAARVDMMRALPLGTKLPGLRPDATKALPDLEIIDGQTRDITPPLLADIRQSLDGEEIQ